MVFIFYCVLIILIALSPASVTSCSHRSFNDSHIFERKSFSIQVAKNRFIRMYDVYAAVEIDVNKTQYDNPSTKFIKKISFKGHIIKDGEDNYEEKVITSLIGYKLKKITEENCTVSFFESNEAASGNIDEQEVAIIQYVQSCLQGTMCYVSPFNYDENANTYYQSIQATINKLVDMFALQLINNFVPNGSLYFYYKYGINMTISIEGLDTFRRTRDWVIGIRKDRIIARIPFTFDQLKINVLGGWALHVNQQNYYGVVELGFTLFPKCAVYLEDIIDAFPIRPAQPTPTFQKDDIKFYLEEYKTEPLFDCDKYLNQHVINKLKELIK